MGMGIVYTRGAAGINAPKVKVEVHLSNGLPSFKLVGLAETAVQEAKERVRSALINSGFEYPARRITVNLAPADIPKSGGRYDLAIALGILIAMGLIEQKQLEQTEVAGELSLNGDIRPVSGLLPVAMSCATEQHTLLIPQGNEAEIQLIEALSYITPDTLLSAFLHFSGQQILTLRHTENAITTTPPAPRWDDIIGQQQAKRALTIAAAGSHNLLMVGPAGTGKSLLASRLVGLLPPLTHQQALATAALYSIKGEQRNTADWLTPPFRSPHHTSSAIAITGGGAHPQPGEVSLAHNGVLFLDELPEFGRQALDVLREPLETGDICLSRASGQAKYPARFQLLTAMNPSPTGDIDDGRSTSQQIQRYLSKLSGPLLDRIDIQIEVRRPDSYAFAQTSQTDDSAIEAKARVMEAYARQQARQGKSNASLSVAELSIHCPMNSDTEEFLQRAATKLKLSMRVFHRTIKVARTIADLNNERQISTDHIGEALGYRALDNLIRQFNSS
ncbi:YifB family Mg chelatase-like AAA ATPase [Alteromonas lipolytica]|uniref:ATP-dependent protease n=1 Tax=Alteromonas lipolytica TaxID=1856405 RepID=A0A1E8FAN2_9ALTE|nr:YifB family Mg chelatase-like AAA ATPase [Alteromonas lipolytica]OFI32975.1 ATP-dependent protease [Alteromonas lipolytica]GGF63668.1 ATP-dependent protease [Alteromonas lipolytica]